jgi:hypothetical protein
MGLPGSGQISPTEARIVGIRVAANVILPDLAQRLAQAKQAAWDYETYLVRLNAAHSAGDVDGQAYSILADEYQRAVRSSRSDLNALEAEAQLWREKVMRCSKPASLGHSWSWTF